jgi:hypothetical protein
VSRSGSTQMEGNRAKMGSIVSEFSEAVRWCIKQMIAHIDVLQKEYDGNMARHAAIPAGTKGKGHVPKKPAELKGFKPPRDSYDLGHNDVEVGQPTVHLPENGLVIPKPPLSKQG